MKTLFVALSSSYVHTLLAPRYLVANTDLPVKIYETNVNCDLQKTLDFIKNENPDVIAFSCYIFNISYIEKLLFLLKTELPHSKIILGGYEATFNQQKLLPLCDFILQGEGDFGFNDLLHGIQENRVYHSKVIELGTVKDLDSIKSPYSDEYVSLSKDNKIIYMETCRGCPFGCAYCMSANTHGVRSFSLQRVFSDFDRIMKHSPKLVKLVDRTFNYDKKRAKIIFSYLIENYGFSGTRFHFETAPELFDDDLFAVLATAPKGLFQFEIGVQSYKKETLDAVNRKADIKIVEENIRRLISLDNIPVHVDLIAGLPCESKSDYEKGFDRLYSLNPDCLQSGFLKVLKGSLIAENADGYAINDFPPYEIISSPCMTKNDLVMLKKTTYMLDVYYNSHRFNTSIRYLTGIFPPHKVFEGLAVLFDEQNVERKFFSSVKQCDLLFDYGNSVLDKEQSKILEKLIYDDFLFSGNVRKWHRFLSKENK